MRELTAARRKAKLRDGLHIDFQLFHIEADLRWIDHAAGHLDHLLDDTATDTELEVGP